MIGNYCRNVTNPQITLDLFAESDNFKLFLGDTGLLISQILKTSKAVEEELYKKIITGHLGTNLGMIFENMVAQMLRARGYELFFHEYLYTPEGSKTEKKFEVDFLIVKDRNLCPIEVKSSAYKTHESFDYFVRELRVHKPLHVFLGKPPAWKLPAFQAGQQRLLVLPCLQSAVATDTE